MIKKISHSIIVITLIFIFKVVLVIMVMDFVNETVPDNFFFRLTVAVGGLLFIVVPMLDPIISSINFKEIKRRN